MSMTRFLRARAGVAVLLAMLGAIAMAAPAAAETTTFHRFEVVATANYVVTQTCADGTTAHRRLTVLGGHEEESEDGTTTLDSDFLTVLIRGFDCEGNFTDDRGSGTADFALSPSLQSADVLGTITTGAGSSVSVEMKWDGTGPMETTQHTTRAPGFTGHSKRQRRDAVATGTVVVDGETLVNGSTTNAEIETREDRNISHG